MLKTKWERFTDGHPTVKLVEIFYRLFHVVYIKDVLCANYAAKVQIKSEKVRLLLPQFLAIGVFLYTFNNNIFVDWLFFSNFA